MKQHTNKTVRILHLSDLHFTPNLSAANNCLSVDQLFGVENRIKELKASNKEYHFDRVLISGDITDDGSVDSLVRARSWICSKLEVNNGGRTGLELGIDPDLIKLIPGNHDVNFDIFNKGRATDRWDRTTERFNSEFMDLQTFTSDKPFYYDWIKMDENKGIYIFFIDTSFLGDGYQEKSAGFDDLSKRRLIARIVENAHAVFDLGVNGQLQIPKKNEKISATGFRNSLKIFVSHHYLRTDDEGNQDFLKAPYRRDFLNRICLADFDILLNGHRHVHSFFDSSLVENLDDRGKTRYIYKQLRNILGFKNLPSQIYNPDNGHFLDRNASFLVRLLNAAFAGIYKNDRSRNIVERLNQAIENGTINDIEALIKNYMDVQEGDKTLHIYDVDHEVKVYLQTLSREQKEKLNKKSNTIIRNILTDLKNKSIISINGGSATKTANQSERTFNIYEIQMSSTQYLFKTIKYRWNEQSKQFDDDCYWEREFAANHLLNDDM